MTKSRHNPKITVVGGGTGSFVLLSALKSHTTHLTAIVNMVDDGGSTGILRDELGVLPAGDVRQCLVALSRSHKLRDLFTYRLTEGTLKGHAFGNLFLATLENMTGSFREALKTASEVLNITGRVLPVTYTPMGLILRDGTATITGQDKINHHHFKHPNPSLTLSPTPEPNPEALQAIRDSDLIVIAPGNLYCSLIPNLLVPQIAAAIAQSPAKTLYIANLVNKPIHTNGFRVDTYVSELERAASLPFIDYVLYNTDQPTAELLQHYAHEGELPVQFDLQAAKSSRPTYIGKPLLANRPSARPHQSDPLANFRTLIRHSPDHLATAILDLI